jgi:Fur family peroxide stress response transcriptional regulator
MSLVRIIAASEGHPNASQLYERIKSQHPTMSQATVYKTLAMLKDLGEVLEIDLHEDSHYDGNKPYPHPHLVCIRCHKIMDGEADLAQPLVDELERGSGYHIVRHQLTFYGYCPDCQKSG